MDNYENEIPGTEHEVTGTPEQEPVLTQETGAVQESEVQEAEPVQEPEVQEAEPVVHSEPESPYIYHNAGTGRKESPFADSPYVMQHAKTAYTPGYTMPKAEDPKPEKKKGGKIWKRIVAGVLILALVGGSCAVTAALVNNYWEDRTRQMEDDVASRINALEAELKDRIDRVENDGTSVSGSPAATVDGLTPGQVYAQNERSVVLVYSEVQSMGQSGYSTGSGFVLTESGYIVTNQHVVEGGTAFLVVTSDNMQHEATLVGSDASNDIAVLKIEAEDLDPVTLGSSDALVVGDQVAAIGNPLGELTSTLTVGYVSAKERYVTTEGSTSINMMQTDCAINSGNSGGPLFNMKGEVVGITSAKYSGTSTSGASIEGIGFAIPIDDVISLIDDIIEFGRVRSAYLGVTVTTQAEPNGVYVQTVEPGWCAEEAGLQAGDIILAVGEYETPTMNKLTRAMRSYDPGDTVELLVQRGNERVTLTITFDEKPTDTVTDDPAEQMPLPEEGDFDEWYDYFRWFFENQEQP